LRKREGEDLKDEMPCFILLKIKMRALEGKNGVSMIGAWGGGVRERKLGRSASLCPECGCTWTQLDGFVGSMEASHNAGGVVCSQKRKRVRTHGALKR